VEKVYQPALGVTLRWRYVTAAAFISVLVLTLTVVGTGLIQFRFFPDVEGDILSAKVELAQGVPFSETEAVVKRIEAAAMRLSEKYPTKDGSNILTHVLSSAGTQPFQTGIGLGGPPQQTHIGEVTLELTPSGNRTVGSE